MAKKRLPIGQKSTWKNRIVDSGWEDPEQLLANPFNYRIHPLFQQQVMTAALAELGWIDRVIINRTTGHVIDGHMRIQLAITAKERVPVDYVELTEAEEWRALSILDPIRALAVTDQEQLNTLLALQEDPEDEHLAKLITQLRTEEDEEEAPNGDDEEETKLPIPAGDLLFPTDNEWDIPVLRLDMQAQACDLPMVKWGTVRRTSKMTGTYHFYTDDYKFNALWDEPEDVVLSACRNAVEPDFSTSETMPMAVGLWAIYRKRWIARYWQENGIRIFVDLNVAAKMETLNLLGVPKGWKAYATRALTAHLEWLDENYETAVEHAGGENGILFIVVGGRDKAATLCRTHGWVHIQEDSARARSNGQGR